jgi:kinase-associated protein B
MSAIQPNDLVTCIYKTGKYIGEVTDEGPSYFVVKILAVVKHPMQGDLHHPKQVDVPFFHERKALAHYERANIPKQMVKPYEGEVPDYKESLQQAFYHLKEELKQEATPFAEKSLLALQSIQKEYEFMYRLTFA